MATTTLPALTTVRQLKDIPALRQLFSLILVALAVAGGFAAYQWAQQPSDAVLFNALEPRAAAEVSEALRAANIPHEVNSLTGRVSVAAAELHNARLKLASLGLPRDGAQGFETFSNDPGFGVSQFMEGARYQHALEAELSRTIGSLQTVASARVHLALPKASAFAVKDAASASVLVELRAGNEMSRNQVASIVHLVASSVPGLAASAVSVIDQSGRLLTRNGDDGLAETSEQFEHTRKLEADYVRRIQDLLAPMMGANRVSAQVSAELDFTENETARESYTPNPQAVRSEQSAEEKNRAAAPQGVPGATSNQPVQPPTATAPGSPPVTATVENNGSESRSSTRNYELDKTLTHTRQQPGSIRRLSVAVLVDHLPVKSLNAEGVEQVTLTALKPEQLAAVESLVKEAVGFSAARGDTVSVQNAAFFSAEAPPPAEPLKPWERPEIRELAKTGLGTLVVLILIFTVLRPQLKSLLAAPLAPPPVEGELLHADGSKSERGNAPDSVSLSGNAPIAVGTAAAGGLTALPPYEVKLQQAKQAVAQDPKRVAQVVKSWVGAEG